MESWALALGAISEADTASVDSSSPPPQVPPQYRQENVNQIPVTSNNSSSLPNNIVSRKETDTAAENTLGLKKANNQIKTAWITGTISGVMTLLGTLFLNIPDLFIDVVLTFGLSFGIYKKSRICAVIMFGYYIASRIFFWEILKGNPLGLIVSIAFIYFFWQGVQGTFAYHKITKM
ncbi:MAG: hypothetical protein ACKPA9_35320 [Microcystis sp.]